MATTSNFVTKSGLTPDETRMPYRISSDDVKRYLQDNFNSLVQNAKGKGINMDDIDIQLYSTEAYSKKYVPFVLVLPLSVLDGNQNKNDADNILTACGERPQNIIRINQYVYKLLQAYTFDETDKKYFRSNDQFRRMYGLSHQKSLELARNASPKIQLFDGGRLKYVAVTLDPIRIFYDMLSIPSDNRKYSVQVAELRKLRKGAHSFTVVRSIVKPTGKNYDVIISELEKNAGK